jgi:[ribosomal protein S5]-alanine N-acetyltransferase
VNLRCYNCYNMQPPLDYTQEIFSLTADRIRLRYFTDGDASFIVSLLNTDSWIKNIGDKKVYSDADAILYLQKSAYDHLTANGFSMMGIELKTSGKLIGMMGLFQRQNLFCPDLGFALLPNFQGQGFAYEAAVIILQYAFTTLKLPKLAAITDESNKRSRALLGRLGFVSSGVTTSNNGKQDLLLYELVHS